MGEMGRIAVIGAGDMGHGIAEVCAIAGVDVFLKDIKTEFLDTAMQRILDSLNHLVKKGKLKEDIQTVMDRIHASLDYQDFTSTVELVIEAVPEVMAIKQSVFKELDINLDEHAVIATNTSYFSISELAAATARPGQVIGMHFFNPPVMMDAVEVIKGSETTNETFEAAKRFVRSIGKLPIPVLKDTPGFIVNRVLVQSQILIGKIVELGLATPAQVDAVVKKVLPMGAFETFDYVGLDIVKDGMDYFAEKIDTEFATPQWIEDLVAAGQLGKKTGKGIFDWSSGRPEIDMSDPTDKLNTLDLLIVQINEASKLIEAGIVEDPGDIDVAIQQGTGNKVGIFGILASDRQKVIERLTYWADTLNIETFRPTAFLSTMPVPNSRKALKRLKEE